MIGKTTWLLRRLFSQIWVRAVSFALLGGVTALAGQHWMHGDVSPP